MLAVARISAARTHVHEARLCARETQRGIMVSPMGNFFTLHVITGKEPTGDEGREAREREREAECLLCERGEAV